MSASIPTGLAPLNVLEARLKLLEKRVASLEARTVNPTVIYGTVTLPNKAAGTVEKLPIETVEEDVNKWWNTVSKRYIPQLAGWYALGTGYVDTVEGVPVGQVIEVGIYKNGEPIPNYSTITVGSITRFESSNAVYGGQFVVTYYAHANGTTDYFEVFGNSSTAGRKGVVKLIGYPLATH